jgi:DNA-binding transcriptional LysR family regulator
MELRQLRSFVTLVEERHFGRAARRENVRQPALSLQIARLEAELGVRLFDRTSRQVRLTEAGRSILGDARLAVRHADEAVRVARGAVEGRHGRLRVSYAPGADCTGAGELVASFRDGWPDVDLESRVDYDTVVEDHLRSGATDAGFLWLAAEPPDDLAVEVLLSDELVVALGASHRLAPLPFVRPDMLLDEPLALLPRTVAPAVWDLLSDRLGPAFSLRSGAVHEEPSHAAIVQAVRRSGVVGLLPACAVPYLATTGVVHRPCCGPGLGLELGLARRRDRAPYPVLDAFLRHCLGLRRPERSVSPA